MQRFYIIAVILFVFFYFTIGFSQFQIQENSPPIVKFVAPKDFSSFSRNSLLPYIIHVSDYEDGNSEYDEINPTEVLLIAKYLKSSSEIKPYLTKESKTNYSSLVEMSRSTCFSCHSAKGKLIGPSFEQIATKYKKNEKAIEFLTEKIIAGGTSIWGDEKMPPHPDLKVDQVQEMVYWILENNSDSDKNYLTGIAGTIKTMEQPGSDHEKSILVLTARYSDHGSNNQLHNSKQGQTTLILKNN
ncbi:c-type cytochrome [Maribacter sp. HTCC2170]|uniref:c-type cytochrome n=1 Tax=Maribacter sp. (strain HTCC2170 / KCCM 42371) TaxID=313603 RepID=UPI00006B47A2|nr:c-type cytochrome [Maribacter sp. HTCC2170]EAR01792.1 cytochrome c family protein [Maribacter sp. HTCC2170]